MNRTIKTKRAIAVLILMTAVMAISGAVLLTACSDADADGGSRADMLLAGRAQYGFERNMGAATYGAAQWDMMIEEEAAPIAMGVPGVAVAAPAEMWDGAADFDNGYTAWIAPAADMPDGGGDTSPEMLTIRAANFAERIIHTISANIETMEFDDTVERIHRMLEQNGGFIENAHVGGRTIAQRDGMNNLRSADFTLRIPQFRIDAVAGSLDMLGNVLFVWRNAQNVTSQFIDTESRLTALRLQEERLLFMLSEATRIADMIDIERRVSDVRFEIERLTSSLMNLQNQVDFSTLTLFVIEVEEYTEPPEDDDDDEPRTYWQQIGDGFNASAQSVGGFFTGLLSVLIVNSPVFAVIAAIAIPAFISLRKRWRKLKLNFNNNPPPPQNPTGSGE